MQIPKVQAIVFLWWMSRWSARAAISGAQSFVERDAHLTAPELITAYGYPVEAHRVKTRDGYLLIMHRMPQPQPQPQRRAAPGQRVALLQHGMLCSSADWLLMGPGKGLAYLLWDAGYDVWMGNARGNTYSKGHDKKVSKRRYWSFSFHEIGVYDLPAMIDHVLATTGGRQLHYVGHSMGTTAFYVLASERPEYNEKVRVMVSLAPIAFLSHMRNGLARFLSSFGDQLGTLLQRAGVNELQADKPIRDLARLTLCAEQAVTQELCYNIMFLIGGFDSQQLNKTMLPVILAHTPAGTSTKVVQHYLQLARSGKFRQMDLGAEGNAARYGRATPPPYDLSRVTAPVALFTGDNDALSAQEDVNKLHKRLSHVIGRYRVPYARFNHLDFLWANDAKRLLYDDVIRLLNSW